MSFGLGNADTFKYGILFEIKTRAVTMGGDEAKAFGYVFLAFPDCEQALIMQDRNVFPVFKIGTKTGFPQTL